MRMKHINITNKVLFIAIFVLFNLFCIKLPNAISDDMRAYRDSGIIGEKKTIQEVKTTHYKNTGITYQNYKGRSFVTPIVDGNIAYFNVNYEYAFSFKCINWEYSLKAYWYNGDVGEERTGFALNLISPEENAIIDIKEIDVPVISSLATRPTEEQLRILRSQSYVEDPVIGEDSILAAQQAIRWILKNEHGFSGNEPIQFIKEQKNNKIFVKAEIDIGLKKCTIWALVRRGYRLENDANKRRMYAWICKVITNSSVDSNNQMQMIFETLDFNPAESLFNKTS